MNQIAIVFGRFHLEHSQVMLTAARDAAKESNLSIAAEVGVAGSFECPLAIKRLLLRPEVDAVVVLGIIERGETKHGLVMAHSVFSAIIQLQLEFMKPIGLGIIGPEIYPTQIESRLVPAARNAVLAVKGLLLS